MGEVLSLMQRLSQLQSNISHFVLNLTRVMEPRTQLLQLRSLLIPFDSLR